MTHKYVVLRDKQRTLENAGPVIRGGPLETAAVNFPEPKVEMETLSKNEVREIQRDREVVDIAPVMPVQLIAPVATQEVNEQEAANMTWGVEVTRAGDSPYSGNDVTAAVLDTGIDINHTAFAGVNVEQKDFTGEGDGDGNGHGTHCAGTVFGQPVNGTRIGVAPGVSRALIGKVLDSQGSGSTDQIFEAIQWAVDEGANVISMSLGFDFPGLVKRLSDDGFPVDLATSFALQMYRDNTRLFDRLAALIRARAPFGQSTVLVGAAGNESKRDVNPDYELNVAPPAAADGIVSVGALGTQGEPHQSLFVADFSNTGPNVSAPGVDVISAKVGGGLVSFNGTSMATPHVAGITALWAEKLKVTTGAINVVELTARLIGSGQFDRLQAGFDPADVGSGLVQAPLA